MFPLLLLAYRSLGSSRLRTGLVAAAVLLGVLAISGVQLTNEAIARGVDRAWRSAVGTSHLQLRAASAAGLSEGAVARVAALPDVAAVAPVVRKRVFSRTSVTRTLPFSPPRGEGEGEGWRGFVEVIGVDPAPEQRIRSYQLAAGRFVGDDLPQGVVVRANWAADRGLGLGDPLDLITVDGFRTFQVVGLLDSAQAGLASQGATVLVPLSVGRQQFGLTGRVSAVSVELSSEAALEATVRALPSVVREPHVARRADDVRAEFGRSISELQGTLAVFGATAFFVAVFLILNTIEMTVVEQTQQIGQLRAAGATRPQVLTYILFHALIPGAAGSVAGSLAGYGLAEGLGTWISRSQDISVAEITFSLPIVVGSAALGLLAAGLSSLWPALRATRLDSIESAQAGAAAIGPVGWRLVGLGVALVGLSTAGLLVPLPAEASQWVRAALLFPLLTGVVLASRAAVVPLGVLVGLLFRRLGGPESRLAAANLVREVGRTTLTVAGFMVALSLLVALAAVGASSARAGERWTLSLVPSELVVVSPVDQPAVLRDQFQQLEEVAYASPVSFFAAQLGRTLVQVASIEPSVFGERLEIVEGERGAAVRDMAGGGSILVPRRLARAQGLRVGDSLDLATLEGRQSFRVAGIVAHSFPSVSGTQAVLMSRADAERAFGLQGFRLLMVQPRPGADRGLATARVAELAERYGMSASTAEAIASDVSQALWRLVALIGALVGIGIVVGAFGTATTMLMNVAQRSRELSVLWASGMSRAQIGTMTVAEGAMIGLIGAILGTALGAALGWVLVVLSRTSGFEPEYVFPLPVALGGAAVAVLAASLATLPPARQAGRIGES